MTMAQRQVNARNHSALLNLKIIEAFWWPYSRADISCMLNVYPSRVKYVWDEAKASGHLPNIERPAKGFNLEALFLSRVNAGRAA
jgi:hypothetical protein